MEKQIPQKLITGQSFHSSFCFWSGPGLYSLLPSVSSSVEHPSQETHPAQKPQASNKNTLSCTASRSQGPKREREDKAARDLCSHLLCGCLRRYFSPGHWHCVQKSAKKNIPASQRAPVPPQCVRNEKKLCCITFFPHHWSSLKNRELGNSCS